MESKTVYISKQFTKEGLYCDGNNFSKTETKASAASF